MDKLNKLDRYILSRKEKILITRLTIVLDISKVSVGLTLTTEAVHIGGGEDRVRASWETNTIVLT